MSSISASPIICPSSVYILFSLTYIPVVHLWWGVQFISEPTRIFPFDGANNVLTKSTQRCTCWSSQGVFTYWCIHRDMDTAATTYSSTEKSHIAKVQLWRLTYSPQVVISSYRSGKLQKVMVPDWDRTLHRLWCECESVWNLWWDGLGWILYRFRRSCHLTWHRVVRLGVFPPKQRAEFHASENENLNSDIFHIRMVASTRRHPLNPVSIVCLSQHVMAMKT